MQRILVVENISKVREIKKRINLSTNIPSSPVIILKIYTCRTLEMNNLEIPLLTLGIFIFILVNNSTPNNHLHTFTYT